MYKKAFTLVELLVTMVIIAILTTIVVVSLTRSQKIARDTQRKSDLASIASALGNYYVDNKAYLVNTSFALISPTLDTLKTGGYIAVLPVDPNGASEYKYKSDGKQYKAIATTPESLVGVTDDNKAKEKADEYYDPNTKTRFQISSDGTAAAW
ncbi:MAG: prepilin-type N-terminal cleavage/methylation domain-containing protein [Patescibacteria group bacterium]